MWSRKWCKNLSPSPLSFIIQLETSYLLRFTKKKSNKKQNAPVRKTQMGAKKHSQYLVALSSHIRN